MSGRLLCAVVVAVLLSLVALPALAQDTPADDPAPLTMAEAERVIYGLRDAINNDQIDVALELLDPNVDWVTRTEEQIEQRLTGRDEVRADMVFFALESGCTVLTQIQRIELDSAYSVGAWTCYPANRPVWRAIVTEQYVIREGVLAALDTTVLPETVVEWDIQVPMLEQLAAMASALNLGDMDAVAEHLSDDVTLDLNFDPLLGERLYAKGRAEVLDVLSAWQTADVVYRPTGWAYKGHRLLVHGVLQWPQWRRLMGVPLYTDDAFTFEGDRIVAIQIVPRIAMVTPFKARLKESKQASEGGE